MSYPFGHLFPGVLLTESSTDGDYVIAATSGTIDFYVDVTNGSDIVGTGTQLSPFKTYQHTLNEACKRLGQTRIFMANGTYVETILTPQYAIGQCETIGDASTPGNVIFDFGANFTGFAHGGSLDVGGNLSLFKNNLSLVFNGVTFKNGIVGMVVDNTKAAFKHVNFVDNAIGLVGADTPQILFQSNADGDATFSHSTGGLLGMQLGNQGSLTVQQDLTLTNYTTSLQCIDSTKLELTTDFSITCNMRDTASSVGLQFRNGSDSALNGDITINGNAGQTTDIGINVENSNIEMGLGIPITCALEDLNEGIKLSNNSFLDGNDNGNVTFTYTNCTTDVVVDSTSSYIHDDDLDTIPTFDNNSSLTDGRDNRAFYFNRYY